MDEALLNTLIRKSESDTLDFKAEQYSFVGESEEEKSELLKDILAFANAWKETNAYILIGVKEKNQRADGLSGVTTHLADNDLQEFINKKTNRPVVFSVEAMSFQGTELDVISINCSQTRPLFLNKNFGRLTKGQVYIRRGSSTAVADADEIAEMGKTAASAILLPTFEMFAFSKREDRNKTGLIGRIRLQLKNSGDRSARHLSATIKHDNPGCLAGGANVDWEQFASDRRVNPRALHYRHSLNPKQSTVIMEILVCERSPFPFNISAELSADDCPPVIFSGAITAEQVANEEHVVFEKKS
jgi:hypothetical protein